MLEQLRPIATDPARSGIFLDFDGTLAEIVPLPGDARPLEGAVEVLQKLGRLYGVVAIVSGRSALELLDWLGPDIEIWGVHGSQRTQEGRVIVSPSLGAYVDQLQTVRAEAEARLATLEGTVVEDKGAAVNLHYRNAADPEAPRRVSEIAHELAAAHGLVCVPAKMSYELRPPIETSKAQVVLERSTEAELRAALFVGDDVVDLPAFDALDELARKGLDTLRVAVRSAEAPQELLERADLVVDGPVGVLGLLEDLVQR